MIIWQKAIEIQLFGWVLLQSESSRYSALFFMGANKRWNKRTFYVMYSFIESFILSFWPDRSSLNKSTTPILFCQLSSCFVFPHPEHFHHCRNVSRIHFVFPLNFHLCSRGGIGSCGLLIWMSGKHDPSINLNVFKCFQQWPKPHDTISICFTSDTAVWTRTSACCSL